MSARRVELTEGVKCAAVELHGGYIGQMIRFSWYFPHSCVLAQVTGQLRQIDHIEGQVRINLTGHAADGGEMDLTEFQLEPGDDITFMVVKGSVADPNRENF